MVIRKPYAFLIKHFKLIHIIMLVLMIFLAYRTTLIATFFSDYFSNGEDIIGQEITNGLYTSTMYLSVFVILIGLSIVLALMFFKNKPIKYYFGSILSYVIIFAVLNISQNTIGQMEGELLSARSVRAISDVVNISLILQVVFIAVTAIRATGFNIKKFDFEEDLAELDVTEDDREEIEVGLDFDSGKVRRQFRKRIRHIKYVYAENKLILNVLFLITFILAIYFGYTKSGLNEKKYKENDYLYVSVFSMKIEDSYITNTNYKEVKYSNNKTILVLRVKIKNLSNTSRIFETGRAELNISGNKYYPIKSYDKDMIDFGEVYQGTKITSTEEEMILCYEVPINFLDKDMYFEYLEGVQSIKKQLEKTYVKVKLSPLDLRKEKDTVTGSLNEVNKFDKSILKNTSLIIKQFDIKEEYKLSYNFCSNGDCVTSYEYLKADILSTNQKYLLKITADFKTDENINFYQFLNRYGTIEYVDLNDKRHTITSFKKVTPKLVKNSGEYFIEVDKDLVSAKEISIVIKIRNQTYIYKLI